MHECENRPSLPDVGHEAENIDVEQLRVRYVLPTGSSSRWIGKLADGTKLVLPT